MPRAFVVAFFVAWTSGCGSSKPQAHPPNAKEEPPCDASAASRCDAERNVCTQPATIDQPRMQDCEAQYQACMRKAGC